MVSSLTAWRMPTTSVDVKYTHPLMEHPPDVGGEVCNYHWDLSLTATMTLRLNDLEVGGRAWEVQSVNITQD